MEDEKQVGVKFVAGGRCGSCIFFVSGCDKLIRRKRHPCTSITRYDGRGGSWMFNWEQEDVRE